ncbi:hypothetical protein lerEdw1_015104 [Lerista edwardsae]|nr:hypothetical protein lerEdw1_015105 [Lerista edwardsae]KAJ6616027.1 hypothetical protein lerEdw1_015104 [Lerista edwardsae]
MYVSLLAASASVSASSSSTLVCATTGQSVLLPFSFQPPSLSWNFISIKWEFTNINGSIPILVYLVDNCSGNSQKWWERECSIHKEVAEKYRQRADIFKNGTLTIYHVGVQDAGVYQATIRSNFPVKTYRTVNLTVTEGISWNFISIKWEFTNINGSIPILVYLVDNCSGNSQKWWERECSIHKEVAEKYRQRADIFKNGTLTIYLEGVQDAGVYQATILSTFPVKTGKVDTVDTVDTVYTVNLTVMEGSSVSEGLCTQSIVRMTLAGLILFFLGLFVVEVSIAMCQ